MINLRVDSDILPTTHSKARTAWRFQYQEKEWLLLHTYWQIQNFGNDGFSCVHRYLANGLENLRAKAIARNLFWIYFRLCPSLSSLFPFLLPFAPFFPCSAKRPLKIHLGV